MRITNGVVGYSKVVKDADFGINRKAEVSLSYIVEEDEDEVDTTAWVVSRASAVAEAILDPIKAAPIQVSAARFPTGKEIAREILDAPLELGVKEAAAAKMNAEEKKEKKETKKKAPEPAVADEDPLGLGIAPAAVAVTDEDLQAAIVRRNAVLQAPPKIRALIAEYAGPPPATARAIPAGKRAAFLEALAKLS